FRRLGLRALFRLVLHAGRGIRFLSGFPGPWLLSRVIDAREFEEKLLEVLVVCVGVESLLAIAQLRDLALDLVTAGARLGGEGELEGAPHEVKLVGAESVHRRVVAGFSRGAKATVPVGRRAEAVPGVLDQGMFRRETALRLVEVGRGIGGAE